MVQTKPKSRTMRSWDPPKNWDPRSSNQNLKERWGHLVEADHRLGELHAHVARLRIRHEGVPMAATERWLWWEQTWWAVQARLDKLVGFSAENPELRTWAAHNLAHHVLRELLTGPLSPDLDHSEYFGAGPCSRQHCSGSGFVSCLGHEDE
jgi:hypothetical protein